MGTLRNSNGAVRDHTWLASTWARISVVLTNAVRDWFRHNDARLGAALAYYSVFSLGPLLLIVVSIAGLFSGQSRFHLPYRPRRDRSLALLEAKRSMPC